MFRGYIKAGIAGTLGLWLLGGSAVSAAGISMEQAVKMALESNLDIKISANQQQQASYDLESSKASQGVSIEASNTLYLKKVNEAASTSSSSVTLSLPLYTGGKNEGNIEIAKTDVKIAELVFQKSKQDVKLKAISAYLDVIEARKTQRVAQETVDNYAKHLENVKAQYSVGNVAKSDVLSSEVQLINAEQTLLKDKNAYEVAVNALKNVIRWKNNETLETVDEFQDASFGLTMAECVNYAKNHRPDLEKYRLAIFSAEKSVDVADADQKPSISATAGMSWDKTLPIQDGTDTYVGIKTSWNVFDNQVTKNKINKAKSAASKARLDLESQEDSVEIAVKEYYLNMKEAEKRREATQTAIHKAEEDYFIAEEKYKVGEGVMLDVIDAQLSLTTAKNNYIQAQYDYETYKAKLENAIGMD